MIAGHIGTPFYRVARHYLNQRHIERLNTLLFHKASRGFSRFLGLVCLDFLPCNRSNFISRPKACIIFLSLYNGATVEQTSVLQMNVCIHLEDTQSEDREISFCQLEVRLS